MNHVDGVDADSVDPLFVSTGPRDLGVIDSRGHAQAERQGQLALGEVAFGWHDLLREDASSGAQFYPGTNGIPVRGGSLEFESDPVMMQLLIVAKEQGRSGNLGKYKVEISIAVDIGIRRAAADDGLEQVRARARTVTGTNWVARPPP